jgi:hypothetical protein
MIIYMQVIMLYTVNLLCASEYPSAFPTSGTIVILVMFFFV